MAELLPRLALLLQSPPLQKRLSDLRLLIERHQPFADAVLNIVGLEDRELRFDPCSVYAAETAYLMVSDGPLMSLGRDAAAAVHRQLTSAAMKALPPGRGHRPKSVPYVMLLDRSDAPPRWKEDGTPARPRDLANMDEVRAAVADALQESHWELRVLRAARVPFLELTRQAAGADGLVGVHGAGLANALLMPPEGAVLELIPARSEINNMFNDSLSSQCGFTMFWYLAAMRGLRYYGVLLHNFAWEDVCVAPPRQVRAQVRRLVRESVAGRSRLRDEL